MKEIVFETINNLLCVRADGSLLVKPRLDTKTIKMAVKNNSISPMMKENLFNTIKRELRDNGFKPNEVQVVVARFEQEFEK